jgi:hypothetical protein
MTTDPNRNKPTTDTPTRAPTTRNRPATEPITHLEEVRAPHNVVAAVPGLDEARDAILELERAGVPADTVSLLGARPDPDGADATPLGGDVAKSAGTGAVAGSVLGAISSVVIPGIGPAVAAGIWAAAGATTGAVVGGIAHLSASDAWRQTLQAVESGNVAVGVHSDARDVVDLAFETLESRTETLSINRFGG